MSEVLNRGSGNGEEGLAYCCIVPENGVPRELDERPEGRVTAWQVFSSAHASTRWHSTARRTNTPSAVADGTEKRQQEDLRRDEPPKSAVAPHKLRVRWNRHVKWISTATSRPLIRIVEERTLRKHGMTKMQHLVAPRRVRLSGSTRSCAVYSPRSAYSSVFPTLFPSPDVAGCMRRCHSLEFLVLRRSGWRDEKCFYMVL